MSDEAILKAACVQAAAHAWAQTDLKTGGATSATMVAERIAKFADMLYRAVKDKLK